MDTKAFNEKNFDKSRAVCEGIEREDGDGRVVLTDRERAILDMWPRFEDGEYVWFGDEYKCSCNKTHVCDGVRVQNTGAKVIFAANHPHTIFLKDGSEYGERVKRTAPKVLDADGVEIKVGDAVWHCIGTASGVVTGIDAGSLMHTTRYVDESGTEFRDAARNLTHTRPDSWERLEMDAELNDETGIVGGNLDIVRRAKKLAGVEAGR